MASRTIHYAIAKKIAAACPIRDFDRFLLGHLLPDAYAPDRGTAAAHLKISLYGGSKKTYDLEKFRTLFAEELRTDDLYRGYYLHLIQDLHFRDFVYNRHQWNPKIPGNVERLHRDYRLANAYVIETYGLENRLVIPGDFDRERIWELYPWGIAQLTADFASDFEPTEGGETFFFTREMAEEFITIAADKSLKELETLNRGAGYTDKNQMAWKNPIHSLLETTLNTRDLGGYPTESGGYTKWNAVIRSDVMKRASEQDVALLRKKGIRTIIDVRGEKDVQKSPNSLKNLEGFQYHHCPIDEGSGVPDSVEEVPYSYMWIAHAKSMGKVFQTIAEAPQGVLFHCTAGKDRTGVISAILLLLAGVSEENIVWDYMVTRECNEPRFAILREKFPELDMNIVIPREENMYRFLELFRREYGTVADYLASLGIGEMDIQKIKNKLA